MLQLEEFLRCYMAWYDLMDEEVERKGYDVSAWDIYG